MKKSPIRIVAAVMLAASLSVSITGQTLVQSSGVAGITTQAQLLDAEAKASSALSSILAVTNKTPQGLYPPGFIAQLQGTADGTLPLNKMAVFPTNAPATNARPTHLKAGDKANMKWLDAQVLMGSPTSEAQRNSDEAQYTAIISYAFYMGNYEVTQDEYQEISGSNPSWFTPANGYTADLDRPVENVTWAQATNYCYLLTQQALTAGTIPSGWAYRLPTEAEWEYSCRDATTASTNQVIYSQTDSSGEQTTVGFTYINGLNTIFTPATDVQVTSVTEDMQAHTTAGGVSFIMYTNGTPEIEQDFLANDPLFAPVQGSFGLVNFPIEPSSYGTYLHAGVGVKLGLGSFQGHEWDYLGSSGGAFLPYLVIYGNTGQNPFTAFSFGNSIHGGMANFYDYYDYDASVGTTTVSSPAIPNLYMTTGIGNYLPNSFGLYDMHGNVSEWCGDWYGAYPTTTTVDPQGPTSGTLKVVRGGSWADEGYQLRSAARLGVDPSTSNSHTGFRIVLAPAVAPWKTTVMTQPPLKTYGALPTKIADGLVLITHGWTRIFPDQSWVSAMSNSIATYLGAAGVTNWQAYGYYWEANSAPLTPDDALVNATQEGVNLGNSIVSQGWTKVHFIAHSAGAQLIQTASEVIRSQAPSTIIQCTFLDPYVGFNKAGTNTYGYGANWSDMYSSHNDLEVGEGEFTDLPLNPAYNVDVTALDPNAVNSGLFSGLAGYVICHTLEASHGWSHQFYENTITGNIATGYDGFGFLLSNESGGWPNAPTQYPVGNINSVNVLGSPPQSCSLLGALAATVGLPIDFTAVPVAAQSITGTIRTSPAGPLTLITGSPVWISIVPTNTDPVNTLSFSADYESSNSGAAGLLTVCLDTNVIGTVDERMVGEGLAQYTLSFPVTASNSTHVLSFRLDPFTNVQSTVILTNVVLGQKGVVEPFSLATTTNTINGQPLYQLTGQSGFDYGLQASTDLVNWTPIATLENTNGTVSFYDPDATNYSQRFYRTVAPY